MQCPVCGYTSYEKQCVSSNTQHGINYVQRIKYVQWVTFHFYLPFVVTKFATAATNHELVEDAMFRSCSE